MKQTVIFSAKAVTFVEYVPINELTMDLAPSDKEREILKENISELRKEFDEIVLKKNIFNLYFRRI